VVYHLRMSREDPQMKIRLPADLKDQIETAAKDSGRSMNAEIVARLERSFKVFAEAEANMIGTATLTDHTELGDMIKKLNQLEKDIRLIIGAPKQKKPS